MLSVNLSFFHDPTIGPALSFGASELIITGREISGFMSSGASARLTPTGWTYSDTHYRVLAVTGGGYLLFDTGHNVSFISDPVDHLYFIRSSLSANAVGIAKYNADEDLWHGCLRRMWYRSFRIISIESVATALAGRTSARLNPWETCMSSTPDASWPKDVALVQEYPRCHAHLRVDPCNPGQA